MPTTPSVDPRPPSASPEPRRAESPRRAEPEILVAIAPAGRETLDAIASELAPKKPLRSPVRAPAESMPEITIHQTPAGRDTLAAINEELADHGRDTLPTLPYGDRVPNAPGAVTPSHPAHTEPRERAEPSRPEIFEMRTFVVQKADAETLKDEFARLDFVMKELAHRLPTGSGNDVTRVDMTPWTEPETLILRVWCRVSPPG